MAHYFTNEVESNNLTIDVYYQIQGHSFHLISHPGVFSKKHLDLGSRLLIEQVLKLNLTSERVLDLGCGYGPIGLSVKHFCRNINLTMSDINSKACASARENTKMLGLNDVTVIESDGFSNLTPGYDLIILNPPIRAGKKTIYKMFFEARDYLSESGQLMIVIRKDQGALSTKTYLEEIYGNCQLVYRKHGYHIYRITRKGA